MALVWVEPFEQYGGTQSLMAAFGYTDVGISALDNVNGRTGSWCCYIFNSGTLRTALNTPVTTLGQGAGWKPTSLGSGSTGWGFRWESSGKTLECNIVAMADYSIGVYDRTGTLLGQSIPNTLINNSYSWVEAKAIGNTGGVGTGSLIVKVNGQASVTVNNINLPNAFAFAGVGSNNGVGYLDDWIIWDTTGTVNKDFVGDRRLYTSFPSAVTAQADFTASSGTTFGAVSALPPVDSLFIDGATAGNISDFIKTAIPVQTNDVAAIVAIGRVFKSDAGAASARVGLKSNATVSNSAEFFPGTTGAWFRQFVELDPDGTIPWTKAKADAALVRITRVT